MKIFVIGTGYMANEYSHALYKINKKFTVIGNRINSQFVSSNNLHFENIYFGGLKNNLKVIKPEDIVINAVSSSKLYETTRLLLESGVQQILIEKPCFYRDEEYANLMKEFSTDNIRVAYNRRYYKTVTILKKIIKIHGYPSSIHFEFTEWINRVLKSKPNKLELQNWIVANSSHIIDIVLYLYGKIKKISTINRNISLAGFPKNGKTLFVGHGILETGTIFSYHSDWSSAGNWNLKVNYPFGSFHLNPLERLTWMAKESTQHKVIGTEHTQAKPGIIPMIRAFIDDNKRCELPDLAEQRQNLKFYSRIKA